MMVHKQLKPFIQYIEELKKSRFFAIDDIKKQWHTFNTTQVSVLKNLMNIGEVTGILEIFPEITKFLDSLLE